MDYMVDMAIRTMITRFLDTHPVVIVDSNNSWTGHYAPKHLWFLPTIKLLNLLK